MSDKINLGLELTSLHTSHRTGGTGRVAQSYFEEFSKLDNYEISPYASEEFPAEDGKSDDWKGQLFERWRLCWEYHRRIPDLIQIIDPMNVPPVSPVPVVTLVHDLIPYVYRERYQPNLFVRYLYWRMKGQIKSSQGIVAPSRSTADDLSMMFALSEDKIRPIPHGIDPVRFQPRSEEKVSSLCNQYDLRRPYFIMVADLSTYDPRKSLESVVKRWDNSPLENTSLVVVGKKGEYARRLKETWPVDQNRLVLPGYVSDDELSGLYSGASALIFPSRHEGFGFPILEAMACGTRPVVRAVGSAKEIVDGNAIQLEKNSFEDELVDALASIEEEDLKKQDCVEHARRYSWKNTVKKLTDFYETLL